MKQPYLNMSFQTLYDMPRVASLDNVIVLNDNFDEPIQNDPSLISEATSHWDKLVSNFTIFVCLDGYIDVMSGMKDYRMQKNDALVSRSGTIGGLNGMSPNCKFFLLTVNSNFYFPVNTSGVSSDLNGFITSHPVCHLSEDGTASTLSIYNILKERLNVVPQPTYIHELAWGMVQALTFNVLSQVEKEVREENKLHEKLSRSKDIYKRFLECVEKNYMRERDIKFYADKLCLTPKYLSQVIYKESGNYAGEHIKKYVIIEAKALIKSRQYTISQICDILNFSSQSFFTKYFRNATGLSPSEYQNS